MSCYAKQMDNMSNSAALQKQIASIMDVLAKAAVAEISKVVDDGVVMLKLEICERENEIDTLKRNLQIVSNELRATRRALVRECVNGRSRLLEGGVSEKDQRRTGKDSGSGELNGQTEDVPMSASRVKIKLECVENDDDVQMVEDASQNTKMGLALQSDPAENEDLAQVWSSEENTRMHSPEFFHSTIDQSHHQSNPAVAMERSYSALKDTVEARCSNGEDVARHSEPSTDSLHVATDDLLRAQNSAGLQPSQSHSHTHNALIHSHPEDQGNFSALSIPARGRPMNRGMDIDKRRFPCMFCGKSFDRLSHVERHQRIHTGEKPFSCGLCGRGFTQKSSLKSHLKTHRVSGLPEEDNHFSNEWHMVPHCEEQIDAHLFINSQETHPEDQNSHLSCLAQEDTHFINIDEERLEQSPVDHHPTLANPNSCPPERTKKYVDFCEMEGNDDDVVCVLEDGAKDDKKEDGRDQTSSDYRPEEPRHLNSGSESVDGEEETQALNSVNASSAGEDLESDCSIRAECSVPQNKYPLDATSTIIHSWGTLAVNTTKDFDNNHIHIKEEDEDLSALDEEETGREICYAVQSEECNVASPTNHNSSAASLRSTDALMLPNLPSDLTGPRPVVVNGVQKRRERRFFCVHCGKSFDRMSHLDRHQRIHTGEKPYSCGLCGRGFTQKSSLKGHLRTHLQERAFHCSVCGMSFPTRAGRYRHSCNQMETTGYLR